MRNIIQLLVLSVAITGLAACVTPGGSVEERRTKAEQGDADSQFRLGVAYDLGQGVRANLKEAATWYRKAAEQGRANAQNSLGSMYQNGQGVPQDFAEAYRWYQKAADQGYGEAYNNIAYLLDGGLGVKQDKGKAIELYHKAAEAGSLNAAYNLAKSYWHGDGAEKDLVTAFMWMDMARFAAQHHSDRQLNGAFEASLIKSLLA